MHMANELLSVPVAAGTIALAGGGLAAAAAKTKKTLPNDKLALMGVMGAFVFAAQMVNFPILTGTSGHMVGAVLLAILLGPHAAAIVMASIIIVQCLIFQDGGLLALGCNIINMGLVPTYLGSYIFRLFARDSMDRGRIMVASIVACVLAVEAGAVLVPIQAALSGVLKVPFTTFLVTMLGIHLLVGLVEGVITALVLLYLREVRPQIIAAGLSDKNRLSVKAVYITLLVAAFVLAAGLSLIASSNPDGLEWSYKERPDQPQFEPIVQNENPAIAAADALQDRLTPMPDYSVRPADEKSEPWAGWTSFAGVIGSAITMALIWLTAKLLKGRSVQTAG